MNKCLFVTLMVVASCMSVKAQLIDFDFPGRNTSEVTEPNYVPWPVGRVSSDVKTLDNGITITITPAEGATSLASNWSKNIVQKNSKLLGDGVFACHLENGNYVWITEGRTAITLTIEGMSPGHHSLIAYHNDTDAGKTHPDVEVYVNGTLCLTGARHSSGATKASESGSSYIEFDVEDGQTMVITYASAPVDGQYYDRTSIMINGLEFDTNPYGIMDEQPANHDYHVDADDGYVHFSWIPAAIAVNHKLVYGTDSTMVADALTYQYEGNEPAFSAQGFSPLVRYWWRVDEVDEDGNVHVGKVKTFQPRRDAFPGAEGYGRYAIGGRGGIVYHVTSLDDDNTPGTLRFGVENLKGQPRTIVFDVAGMIALNSRLVVSDRFVTIAGQTAPGRGILLRNKSFGMQSDGITRFLRLHLGGADDWNDSMEGNPNTADGMGMTGNEHAIMDHCSIAWSIDEGFSSRGGKTLTLQKTIISEALNYAGHATQYEQQGHHVEHGYAATIGGGEMGGLAGSYHHNLLAHCQGRNWSMSGGLDGAGYADGHHDMFNNVCYNWGGRTTDGGTHEGQFVANYYKMGPSSNIKYLLTADLENVGMGTQSYYVAGNIRENKNGTKTEDALNETYRMRVYEGKVVDWEVFRDVPFFPSWANVETAEAAYKNVLSDVGCNMPEIDNHDQRMVEETLNGTYSVVGRYTHKKGLPDCEADCGGFESLNIIEAQRDGQWDTDQDGIPNWFENIAGTDPDMPNNNDDRDGDDYTDLEEYLNWVAVPNFIVSDIETMVIDLKPYFAGYKQPELSAGGATVSNGQLFFNPEGRKGFVCVDVTAYEDGVSLTRSFHFAVAADDSGVEPNTINNHDNTGRIYSISGYVIPTLQKGINILNNKKVLK